MLIVIRTSRTRIVAFRQSESFILGIYLRRHTSKKPLALCSSQISSTVSSHHISIRLELWWPGLQTMPYQSWLKHYFLPSQDWTTSLGLLLWIQPEVESTFYASPPHWLMIGLSSTGWFRHLIMDLWRFCRCEGSLFSHHKYVSH